jgi:hypothetical protein
MNPLRKGLAERHEDWRWSSYNNFALDKATVSACPIQIDHVRFPLGYRACENPTVRKALTVASAQLTLEGRDATLLLIRFLSAENATRGRVITGVIERGGLYDSDARFLEVSP